MKKRKRKYMFIIFICLILIVGCFIISLNDNNQIVHKYLKKVDYKDIIEIKLNSNIPLTKDYSDEFISDITWLNDKNSMNKKAGIYKGLVLSNYHIHIVTLKVVDNNSPIFKDVKDITIYEGDNIDLISKVKVSDDSNEDVSISVSGNYSTKKAGTYSLTYEATDKSGNTSKADFKLIVKKKEKETVPLYSSKGYEIIYKNGAYYIENILIANKTFALSKSYNPNGLTKETNEAFKKMQAAAKKEGVNIRIISGFRSYNTQVTLYNNYVRRDGQAYADRYSARAGHSEHQTGLAFDINSLEQSFKNTKEGKWLNSNCYKYGFILRYPENKESITGYMFEPWHFRYIGDEAKNLYNNGNWITLEEYLGVNSKYSS